MYDGSPMPPKHGASFTTIFCITLLTLFAIAAVMHFVNGNMEACLGELFLCLMEICFLREEKFHLGGDKLFSFLYTVTGIVLGLIGNYLIMLR